MVKDLDNNLLLFSLGIIAFIYYILDVVNNVVYGNGLSWLLWYSSAGLFITAISLISRNRILIYSSFSALFVPESIWSIDFVFRLLTAHSLFGFTNYLFLDSYSSFNFFMSLYHLFIPVLLLLAVIKTKKVYSYGWIGAVIYSSVLIFMSSTYPAKTAVNCIYPSINCNTIFSFLYEISSPLRLYIAIIGLTILVFIPSNLIAVYMKTNRMKTP